MHKLDLEKIAVKLSDHFPWTNVYGVARTLLAAGTLLTLTFNSTDILFHHLVGVAPIESCYGISRVNIFCLLQSNLPLAKGLSSIILVTVISGWRPRITGILHWWVSASLYGSSASIDGGDQITSIITFLLIPVCLTDERKWHWDSPIIYANQYKQRIFSLVSSTFLFMIRVQVAILYFHSAVAKFKVEEWVNGTCLYYWFNHNTIGVALWIRPALAPLLSNEIFVTFLTWGVLLFEIILFGALFMQRSKVSGLLLAGIFFHFGIFIIHGLLSFFFAMSGALVLYLRPSDSVFKDFREFSLFRRLKFWPLNLKSLGKNTPSSISEN